MSRRKEKQRQRKRRRQECKPRAGVARSRREPAARASVDLRVRHPELAHPPVYVDARGVRVADPFDCLGLDPEAPVTQETVQAAFRAAIAATPPESNAQRAIQLVEARDRLLQPKQALTRILGDLRVPNAEHFVPGHERKPAPGAPRRAALKPDWSARSRLVAIMTLYALLEAELADGSEPGAQTGMLFE